MARMFRSERSTSSLAKVCFWAFSVVGAGCSRTTAPAPPSGTPTGVRADALAFFADRAVVATESFRPVAASLRSQVDALATDVTSPAAWTVARDAWKEAMNVWQRVELLQYGPAAMTGSPGGRDMRDGIYSWPLVSRCLIEQKLVSRGYADATDFAATPITAKGLAALEYLLFYEGTDNACAPNAAINTSGAWAAFGEAELRARKAAYAAVVAADVARRGETLANAWAPLGENFADSLKTAGRGSTVYGTDQMALNAVSDALFYIESETKDMKLAFALGLATCGSRPCPLSTESPYARVSAAHAVSNIAAFDELLTGRPVGRTGFVGLLDSVGARELADRLQADVDEAKAAAAELTADAFEKSRDDEAVKGKVARVHDALRALAIDLKSQFLSLLDLELPKRVEGDND